MPVKGIGRNALKIPANEFVQSGWRLSPVIASIALDCDRRDGVLYLRQLRSGSGRRPSQYCAELP